MRKEWGQGKTAVPLTLYLLFYPSRQGNKCFLISVIKNRQPLSAWLLQNNFRLLFWSIVRNELQGIFFSLWDKTLGTSSLGWCWNLVISHWAVAACSAGLCSLETKQIEVPLCSDVLQLLIALLLLLCQRQDEPLSLLQKRQKHSGVHILNPVHPVPIAGLLNKEHTCWMCSSQGLRYNRPL